MKRWISFLIILIILLGTSFNTFAAKKSEMESINITDGSSGKEYNVKVVNVIMGGSDVISDVPAILFDSRTLVPVRFISENLGAEVSWNQNTYEATIKTEDKEIILKIDSAKAKVNGKEYILPDNVPAKLIGYQDNYRTMVPLRFVSEQLGMEVGWIGETMTATIDVPLQRVKDIRLDTNKKFPEIAIKTTGKVKSSAIFFAGSEVGGQDKLIIDIPNTVFDIEDKTYIDSKGLFNKDVYEVGIKSIRASQFKIDPFETRIVLDLDYKKGYNIFYDEQTKELKVQFINSVNNISVEKIYDVDTVVINTSEEPAYNIKFYEGKVIVDVLNSLMKHNSDLMDINKGGILNVRKSQYDPSNEYSPDDKVGRVVIDLDKNITLEDVYIEHIENEIFVYVSGNPLDRLEYYKEDINIAKFAINTDEPGEYSADYNSKNNTLTLKVLKDKVELKKLDLDIDDNIIKTIDVNDTKSSKYYYITVKLTEDTTLVNNTKDDVTDKIEFTLINDKVKESKYKDMLVVIDPGHGGKDPGAISPNIKVKEKDIVLEVSTKLKKQLEKSGFKVYMTRDDDNYIGLYDRATIANELGAHAFVSIHANAHPNKDVEGIQVLYYPDDGSRGNLGFSKIMMDSLTKGLGAPNKGIIKRPNLVVPRETKMPAVLLELGFLTNYREENLLNTSEYRTKAADSIHQGIIKYFDQVILGR